MVIRPFRTSDETEVISLWRTCGLVSPANDPHLDIVYKQKVNPELFLVGELDGKVVGTCMAGYEGHRGWINYVAVHPEHQRNGYASRLLNEAERLLREQGCPKINLQIRNTNTAVSAFYEKRGFSVDPVISMGKRL